MNFRRVTKEEDEARLELMIAQELLGAVKEFVQGYPETMHFSSELQSPEDGAVAVVTKVKQLLDLEE